MFFWFCIVLCALAGCFVTTRDVMTGEPREVAVNGTRVVNAARFAVVEFNKANAEDVFAYKLSNISSAKIQVKLVFWSHAHFKNHYMYFFLFFIICIRWSRE